MRKKKLTQQQLKSLEVKNRIYESAMNLLKKYHYNALTVRNICDEANVSTGTFYHHFKNKDDLLSYFFYYAVKDYLREHEIIRTENIVENIINVYDVYLTVCISYGIEFLSNYYSSNNKGIYIRDKQTEEQLKLMPVVFECFKIVNTAKIQGFIKENVTANEVVIDFGVIIKGIILDWCISNGTFDLKKEAFKLIKYYLHGLLTEKYFNQVKN